MPVFWFAFLFLSYYLLFHTYATPIVERLLINGESPNTIAEDNNNNNRNKTNEDDLFDFDARIVGGLPATILNFPYQVSLQYKGQHICGGTIIQPKVIITAAHCVDASMQATAFAVRAGSTLHSSGGQVRTVKFIFRHEGYTSAAYNYDIALLELNEMLIYSKKVQPIQLAESNASISVQTKLFISGWGLTSETGHLTMVLNYVAVKLIRKEICVENYKYIVPITAEMLCAGHANDRKDACQGDSGGPLVASNKLGGMTKLHGIVSWGVGCAQKEYPGVYAKVSALRPWIDAKLADIQGR